MDREKLGGYLQGDAITSFSPTICLEKCKSNYVSILVQFVIPLHRFSEDENFEDFKARSSIKFTWSPCIRMKLYSNTKLHYTLTYFTSIQMLGSLLVDIF